MGLLQVTLASTFDMAVLGLALVFCGLGLGVISALVWLSDRHARQRRTQRWNALVAVSFVVMGGAALVLALLGFSLPEDVPDVRLSVLLLLIFPLLLISASLMTARRQGKLGTIETALAIVAAWLGAVALSGWLFVSVSPAASFAILFLIGVGAAALSRWVGYGRWSKPQSGGGNEGPPRTPLD